MAKCRNRANETEARLRAAAREAIRTAAEEEQAASMEEDMPMCRYAAALPSAPPPCRGQGMQTALLEQLLEETCRQNQLLLDLISAVNGLTGALMVRE